MNKQHSSSKTSLALHRRIILLCTLLAFILFGVSASAGDRAYVLVSPLDNAGPSAVVAFDVDAQGLLTQRESYNTGGYGRGMNSGQEIVVHPSGRFLFALNNEAASVSVFTISSQGLLNPVAGSPFIAGSGPMSLAFHPSGNRAYVTEWLAATVGVFAVDPSGRMNSVQQLPVAPYPRELRADPLGRCLYVADMGAGLRAYDLLAPDGQLREISGSPFSTFGMSRPYCVQVGSDGRRAFLLDLDGGLSVYNLSGNGTPSFAGGTGVGGFAHQLKLMPNNRFIYVGLPFQNEIAGFGISNTGAPAPLPGSPFFADETVAGLTCSPNGARLYAATRERKTLQTFAVAANGSLSRMASIPVVDVSGRMPNGIAYWSVPGANRPPVPAIEISPLFSVLPNETNLFVLSRDNVSAAVVLDASRSSDPDGDSLGFSWFADGNTAPFANSSVSTNAFHLGPHTVTLAVSDSRDTAFAEVNFQVVPPSFAVGQILALMNGNALPARTYQPLKVSLESAISSVDRGDFNSGLHQLNAFQNKVRAQVAPLDPVLATQLTQAAQAVAAAIAP